MPAYFYTDGVLREIPLSVALTIDPSPTIEWDFSESNLPWLDVPDTSTWPSTLTIVPLQTGGADFYTNLKNTCNAASGKIIVRLPAGVFSFNRFRMIGASGDPHYSFGFWDTKLQGFLGAGAGRTFVQMDANSMDDAQLAKMSTLKAADFAPLQMGLMRIDGSPTAPIYIAGVTFRSADQQEVTSKPTSTEWYNAAVPQSAPHQGLVLYGGGNNVFYISDVRFQGAGRALSAAPPFEMANVTSQKATGYYDRVEFDGRRSPDLDPNRRRVCGPLMLNNEKFSELRNCWGHHCNLSRYAANDENGTVPGVYRLVQTKFEQISNNNNYGNGGTQSQASVLGWESSAALIELVDVILCQDNTSTQGAVPHHISLTVTGHNLQGGRMKVTRGIFRNVFAAVDGYLCIRIPGNNVAYWDIDGHSTTIDVRDETGARKTDWNLAPGSAWPPTAATQAAAGVSPATHYLIRD